MNPRVSVIVPLYNGAWSLEETLASLSTQYFRDFEVIVVNDGSDDDGPAMAARAAAQDPRFRVVTQVNRGLAAARNTGLDLARGEYVYFLDADDRLLPWGLETLVSRADLSAEAAGGVYARTEFRDSAGRPVRWSPMLDLPRAGHSELLDGCVFPVIAALTRRSSIGAIRFDPSIRTGEDWDFWLRLSEAGASWLGIERVVAIYRMSPGSLSRSAVEMWRSLDRTARSAHARSKTPEAQRVAVTDALGIEWATAHAAIGTTAWDESIRLLRSANLSGPPDPRTAAIKAFHRIPWALGCSPARWASADRELLRVTAGWWSTLEASRLAPPGFAERALLELAATAASPDHVSSALLASATAAQPVLYGAGRNARWLVDDLRRAGRSFRVVDDVLTSQPVWAEDLGVSFPVARPFTLTPDDTVIVTMTDDLAVSPRSAPSRTHRWREAHARIAQEMHDRFMGVLEQIGKEAGHLSRPRHRPEA